MTPIFHLSIPVRSLEETRKFYERWLNAKTGRVTDGWLDLWCFGGQITIQNAGAEMTSPEADRRFHFGGTVSWADWEKLKARLDQAGPDVQAAASQDDAKGQAKIYLTDPNGYVIEIKAYRSIEETLQPPRA